VSKTWLSQAPQVALFRSNRPSSEVTVNGLRAEHMDNLASMSVFVRAADARSFTEAGTQLGVSPSAIGKTIARLEERLVCAFFIAARAALL